ncbi:MAG: hypothetical protein LBS99_06270 [Clostridiales bacterium]|jgi:hypothetical protein|nr:hypothetical protein [Clostridiales bacterium]
MKKLLVFTAIFMIFLAQGLRGGDIYSDMRLESGHGVWYTVQGDRVCDKERFSAELEDNFADIPDIYIDNIGTGATFRGIGEALRERFSAIECGAIDGLLTSYSNFWHGFNYTRITIAPTEDDAARQALYEFRHAVRETLLRIVGEGRFEKSAENIVRTCRYLQNNPGRTVFTTMGD